MHLNDRLGPDYETVLHPDGLWLGRNSGAYLYLRKAELKLKSGQLLFYRDHNQDGTGDVNTPSLIGLGGWNEFLHVFSPGGGIIYAVNREGELLKYRDRNGDGSGNVHTPSVIGRGDWHTMKQVFASHNDRIYAVNQQGDLLYYERNATGDVINPSVIGTITPNIPDGWGQDKFLFVRGYVLGTPPWASTL